jgi:hypothetical protein
MECAQLKTVSKNIRKLKKTNNRFLQNTPNKLIMKFPWE